MKYIVILVLAVFLFGCDDSSRDTLITGAASETIKREVNRQVKLKLTIKEKEISDLKKTIADLKAVNEKTGKVVIEVDKNKRILKSLLSSNPDDQISYAK